jgi:hypothetical protein
VGNDPDHVTHVPFKCSGQSDLATEHLFAYTAAVADLPIPELVENRRRSVAMLPPGAPALNRDEALEVLRQLVEALHRLQKLERSERP